MKRLPLRVEGGFTLLEVMIGLALLGLALTVLIKSAAGSIFNAEEAHMMGVVTELARGKMYDIEEILLKDGFSDTDQSHDSEECFTDEGWPNVCYSYKVQEPKLPSLDELQDMAKGKAKQMMGSGAGSGSASLLKGSAAAMLGSGGALQDGMNSGMGGGMLGGMLGMAGAFGTSQDIDATQGGQMIASQYSMFQEVLKVSVRKVTLHMKWKVLGSDRDMKVVAFFTDPGAMNKTMLGGLMNAADMQNQMGGSGKGSGSGSGTKTTTPGGGKGTGK